MSESENGKRGREALEERSKTGNERERAGERIKRGKERGNERETKTAFVRQRYTRKASHSRRQTAGIGGKSTVMRGT